MGSTAPRPLDGSSDGRGERCVSAADLTAFALDELPVGRRAAISRHLLRCASCRTSLDREQAMFARLRGFAETSSWEDDLAAADLAHGAQVHARRRGALAGAAAAAALVAALLSWPMGSPSPASAPGGFARPAASSPITGPAGSPISIALSASAQAALLRAQATDGRWRASTGDERHDVGATGLAVLALARTRSDALHAGPASSEGAAVRAVANGVRWLSAHLDADDARPDAPSVRDRVVAAAALLEVYGATNERSLRSIVDHALRRVAHDARESDARDTDARAWTHSTLSRARELGWSVGSETAGAADAATASAPSSASLLPAGFSTALAFVDVTPTH
jgi:hypothetical protein